MDAQVDLKHTLVCVGTCRYELQYAVAGRSGGGDDTIASWKSAEGNTHDTWDITIQVDGFDRYNMISKLERGGINLGLHVTKWGPHTTRIYC